MKLRDDKARSLPKASDTVRDLIRDNYDSLTQAERKLANFLLENYPAAGLASITIVPTGGSCSIVRSGSPATSTNSCRPLQPRTASKCMP